MSFFNPEQAAVLREYLDDAFPDLILRNHPTLAYATHITHGGSQHSIPVKDGYTTGIATSMPNSLAVGGKTSRKKFQFDPSILYASEQVNRAQAEYTDDKDTSVVNSLTDSTKTVLTAISETIEKMWWQDGSAQWGKIASSTNPSGNTYILTLTAPYDAYRWQVGMQMVSKATAFAGSLDAGTPTVTGVDTSAGTVTVLGDGTWTPTNAHFIGLRNLMIASTGEATFYGFPGYNPDYVARAAIIAAGADSFGGLDRRDNPDAKMGIALNGTGMTIRQAINALMTKMSNVGGVRCDTLMANPADVQRLVDEVGSGLVVPKGDVKGYLDFSIDCSEFMTSMGPVTIVPATFVPQTRWQAFERSNMICASPSGALISSVYDEKDYMVIPTDDVAQIAYRASGWLSFHNVAGLGNIITP
jgi:hypothetical protein